MRAVPPLLRREANAILLSPIAYVVTAVFLLLSGYFFYAITVSSLEPSMRYMMDNMAITLLFVTPMITMRLLAEEAKSGTLQTLVTAPVTDLEVVLSKFLAGLLFYCVMVAPTFIYGVILCGLAEPGTFAELLAGSKLFITLTAVGCAVSCVAYVLASKIEDAAVSLAFTCLATVILLAVGVYVLWTAFHAETAFDWGQMASGYLGLLLLGGLLVSIGLLFSSLTQNQVVAAISSLVVLLLLWVIGPIGGQTEGMLKNTLEYISLLRHLASFSKGLIDTRDVIYFVSITAFALFLTVRSVESRKWR